MAFGLTNAPATFQRQMEHTLKDLPNCLCYLANINVYSKTFEDHLIRLESVFQRLKEVRLKPSKCKLFQRDFKYLGHIVSESGTDTDPGKLEAIQHLQPPTRVHELRQMIGLFGYYRRFVEHELCPDCKTSS